MLPSGTRKLEVSHNDAFHFEKEHHYRLQGNELYESAAHRRKREKLKESKFIQRSVFSLWAALGKREDDTASRDEYISLHVRISACVAPDMTRSERLQTAAEEWVKDVGGKPRMSFEQFTNAMHEMADIWTEGVSEVEYKYFLDKLHARITEVAVCPARKSVSMREGSLGGMVGSKDVPLGAIPTTRSASRSAPLARGRSATNAMPGAHRAAPPLRGSSTQRDVQPPLELGISTAKLDVEESSTKFTLRPEDEVVCIGKKPRARAADGGASRRGPSTSRLDSPSKMRGETLSNSSSRDPSRLAAEGGEDSGARQAPAVDTIASRRRGERKRRRGGGRACDVARRRLGPHRRLSLGHRLAAEFPAGHRNAAEAEVHQLRQKPGAGGVAEE